MARLNTAQPANSTPVYRHPGTPLSARAPGRERERESAARNDRDVGEKGSRPSTNIRSLETNSKLGHDDDFLRRQRTTTIPNHKRTATNFEIFCDERDDDEDSDVNDFDDFNEYMKSFEMKKKELATRKRQPLRASEVNSYGVFSHSPSRAVQVRNRRGTRRDYGKEDNSSDDEDELGGHARRATRDNSNTPARSWTRRHTGRTMEYFDTSAEEGEEEEEEENDAREEEEEEEEESSSDESSDSLDGFIVSDNEEISYYDTSGLGTDDESPPSVPSSPPPIKPAKRRSTKESRPPRKKETKELLVDTPPRQASLNLEPSLPEAIRLTPDRKAKDIFHNDLNISRKLDILNLDDDDDEDNDNDNGDDLLPTKQEKSIDTDRTGISNHSPARRPSLKKTIQKVPETPSKSQPRSPTKEKLRIPPTPYRESTDSFWHQEATNDWNDQHSPQKNKTTLNALEELLCDFSEPGNEEENEESNNDNGNGSSDTSTKTGSVLKRNKRGDQEKPLSKTAQKKSEIAQRRMSRDRKKSFDAKKGAMAEEFFRVLDNAVTGGKVQREAEPTGGVKITWLATLKSTAGRARWRRPMMPLSSSSSSSSPSYNNDDSSRGHHASIELAEHIVDDEDRLINTLTHEYCHLANYMITGNSHERAHGNGFKKWGLACMKALQDHPVYGGGRITVTTKHDYKINYKYVWCCEGCGNLYQRHSKSINPLKVACGVCRGKLQQIKPKPRRKPGESQTPICVLDDDEDCCAGQEVEDVSRAFGGVSLSGK